MTTSLIAAGSLALPGPEGTRLTGPGWVRVAGGRIAEVGEGAPPAAPDLACDAGVLAPGLIDLQVNGYYGYDFADAGDEAWAETVRRLPETGVTAILPTFITAPIPVLAEQIAAAARRIPHLPADGARVLGLHVEGPFLSSRRPGAHNTAWMSDPTPADVDRLLAAGSGHIAMLTLAPERDGALAAIKRLDAAGVLVSVGHSDALATQVAAAADAGARKVTHLFNAQRPMTHREPGVPGQALTDERLTSGLIADLHHVHPSVCRLAFAAAPGRVCIVTDAASSAGMPAGRYRLGGEAVNQPAEGPPLRDDGTIAGSALRLDLGVANMIEAGVDPAAAVDSATRVPAALIGQEPYGRIAPGAAADLTWLGPDWRARATWVAGRQVFGGTA
ncbi:MAG: N-acetylglucosamine-6-phosphate deacetylase [Streptosporangiales bacterium]|nr:N-acetylglucosamine-6-phosphate deacetylase [Streptosporangiales bacterium]